MEPEEGLEKVQDALRVCQSYQATYHDRRTNLGQYFKQGPTVEWQFRPTLVFARLDMCTLPAFFSSSFLSFSSHSQLHSPSTRWTTNGNGVSKLNCHSNILLGPQPQAFETYSQVY